MINRNGPKRPALRYFGGKWRLAPWVLSHFPPHVCYVEPFSGAASVLLRKQPSELEVINDLDGDIVNFFRVLREWPDDLIRAIQLTPYAREEFHRSYDLENRLVRMITSRSRKHAVERARRLYVKSIQSYNGRRKGQYRSGWRFEKNMKRGKRTVDEFNQVGHLWDVADRLKNVQVENDDALRIIERYDTPETLFYLDPPYLAETRSQRWRNKAYMFEMVEEEHVRLADLLRSIQGMAVISGYPSPLYDELYTGWEVRETRARAANLTETEEKLWISPAVAQKRLQRRLFV